MDSEVGSRFVEAQSDGLAARPREAWVEAKVVPAEGQTHATIHRELGLPDDVPTQVGFEFLGSPRGKAGATSGSPTS